VKRNRLLIIRYRNLSQLC